MTKIATIYAEGKQNENAKNLLVSAAEIIEALNIKLKLEREAIKDSSSKITEKIGDIDDRIIQSETLIQESLRQMVYAYLKLGEKHAAFDMIRKNNNNFLSMTPNSELLRLFNKKEDFIEFMKIAPEFHSYDLIVMARMYHQHKFNLDDNERIKLRAIANSAIMWAKRNRSGCNEQGWK